MLELRNVAKSFGKQKVLTDIDLAVREHEMIAIMGKSGAGKSTLLGIMSGLVRPDRGSVLFGERDLGAMDEESLASFRLNHIGFIFQDFKLIPSLSAHDNILLSIFPRRDIAPDEKERRIIEFAGHVGLTDKLNKKTDNLSGGEKQRVAIARSLVNRPGLVLADEPTGNLDAASAEEIMGLFMRLHETINTTFLLITHDQDIAAYAKKIYMLKEGVLI